METGSWQQQQVALVMVLMLIQIAEQRPVRARAGDQGRGCKIVCRGKVGHSTVASQSTAVKLQYFRVVEQRKNYKLIDRTDAMCVFNELVSFAP